MILQRMFSRKDYENLTDRAKEFLKEDRNALAKKIREQRNNGSLTDVDIEHGGHKLKTKNTTSDHNWLEIEERTTPHSHSTSKSNSNFTGSGEEAMKKFGKNNKNNSLLSFSDELKDDMKQAAREKDDKLTEEAEKRAKSLRAKKIRGEKLKSIVTSKSAKVAGGVALTGATAYAGKKAYDHYKKNKKEERNEKD